MAKASPETQWNAIVSLLRYVTQKPHLLLEHADGYSQLIGQEIIYAFNTWFNRLLFGAFVIVLLSISGVLGGVALMLWASLPAMHLHMPLLLWLVPLIPFVFALICLLILTTYMKRRVFFDLWTQITTDVALLRDTDVSS